MIERGRVNKGDKLELVGGSQTKTVTVASIAARSDEGLTAEAGERVDLVIKGASLKELARGKVLADPKSIKAYTNFKARIDLLETSKGGRSGGVAAGFRPMFMIRSTGFSGVVKAIAGKTVLQPGEKSGEIEIELEIAVALEKGTNFSIRDGSRIIGSGTVTGLDR
jgi:elongation factor Tu